MYKPGKRDSHNYKKPIIHCLFLSSDSQAQPPPPLPPPICLPGLFFFFLM